jgi:hypothetical protein
MAKKRSFSPSEYPRSVSSAPHVLVDRKGNQWLGKILERSFTVKTSIARQTLEIKRERIQSVVYENAPTYAQDRLITVDGMVLNGVVRPPASIRFRPHGSRDVLVFPVATVLALKIDGQ